MPKLTPSEIIARLSTKTGLPPEQVKAVLQAHAELAYAEARNGFPVIGIGTLAVTERTGITMTMRFGPKAGEQITVPPKRVVKFRVSRLAKEVISNPDSPLPDLFAHVDLNLTFSLKSQPLADPAPLISAISQNKPLTVGVDDAPASISVHQLPELHLPTGQIVAADAFATADHPPFSQSVPPGHYPLFVITNNDDNRVAFAILRFSSNPIAKWCLATTSGKDLAYPVDSGTGCFTDLAFIQHLSRLDPEDFSDDVRIPIGSRDYHGTLHISSPAGSFALFSSGKGDGRYPSYFALDASNNPVLLLTDFLILNWPNKPST